MKIKVAASEKLFNIANYIFLALCAFVTIFPFLNILAVSFSSSRAIISGEVFLLPVEGTITAYKNLIQDGQLIQAFVNSVVITVTGTIINIVATIMVAYPLSRKTLPGKSFFLGMIVFTMLFGGGMIPSFILIKMLGLINTYGSLWFPSMVSVFNMIVLLNFFRGIPAELEEAADIDGANDIYKLVRIVLPLSLPVIASLTLFYAVHWWNSYFSPMMYITTSSKQPMTVKLMQMISNFNDSLMKSGDTTVTEQLVPEGVKAAAIIITITPILSVYPFLQKYFVKGVMIGAIKG